MEDYKKKYEEALETARKINSGEGVAAPEGWSMLEVIFPELKESDDERIRKELLDYLDERKVVETPTDTKVKEEWIEWLEKHPIFDMPKIEFKVGDWVIFKCGIPENVYKVEKLENYEYTLEHFFRRFNTFTIW